MNFLKTLASTAAVLATLGATTAAHASLNTFQIFNGNVGVSSDGWGSTTQAGTISAFVPAGATVLSAYLYTSTFTSVAGAGGTLAGSNVNYATRLGVTAGINALEALRADVTNIVKPLIDGGPGGQYNFRITETSANQDGSALVVVYSLPTLAVGTVAILDGFSNPLGDSTTFNFQQPVNTTDPNFSAEMRLGIGFSFDGTPCGASNSQVSSVTVNSTVITNNAGCNDDSADASAANGNLITVGGDDDSFSPNLPTVAQDRERYNLTPRIANGATQLTIATRNASNDDNIFLAVLKVSGATIDPPNPTPEPMSLALVGLGLAGLGLQRRRAAKRD